MWIHFTKESAERRLFTMRDRLKVQYRATQQAQVSESKAADSKKRFSSYIFHEVGGMISNARNHSLMCYFAIRFAYH